ncbi:MAG: HEAT repeat domain-containing protein [Candidatus Loosdrechtia sp.]|uniref:HEAT repeat domain-containing protein n=1 Tax=Candidatus Loosdrechtia sp. TaxID=3101272 RepID=UPI003A790B07|nr:MAG: HEAT repeat domain-containing protein [Candidatus Jettenia sp. AMX2]
MIFLHTIKKYISAGQVLAVIISFISLNYGNQRLWGEIPENKKVSNIKWENGQLSVRLVNSPVKEVLKEIMERCKARIWINDSIDDMLVTAEFQNVPVREAVRIILKDINYAFVYAPGEIREGKISMMTDKDFPVNYSDFRDTHRDSSEATPKRQKPPRVREENTEDKKESLESLIKDALESESAEKREKAVIALARTRDEHAIEAIAKVLMNDTSEEVRLSSIDALFAIGDANVIQPLSAGLKDRKPSVRASALEALADIGGEAAIELVKSAINDEDESVRVLVRELLEELGNENEQ